MTVYDGATRLGSTTAGSSGSWSYTLGVLSNGSHSLTATAADVAGNIGPASNALAFTVDAISPTGPTVALTSDTGTPGDKITSVGTLAVSGTEQGATVEYSANGTSDWSTTAPTPTQGANSFYVRQVDLAGNASSATQIEFTLDTAAPAVAITSTGGLTRTAAQTITGTGEAGTSVDVMDGTTKLTTVTVRTDGTWSAEVTLSGDRDHAITAVDTDAAGNSAASTAVTYMLDTRPRAPTDIALSNSTVAENSPARIVVGALSATDPDGGAFTYSLLDNAGGRFALDGVNLVTTSTGLNYEASASHSVRVQVTDNTGLTYEEVLTIGVTNVNDAPDAVNDGPVQIGEDTTQVINALGNDTDEDGNPLTITGATAASGSTVQIVPDDNGRQVLLYTADASSFDPLGSRGTAPDTITYTVSDGRGGTDTATVAVTVRGAADGAEINGTVTPDNLSGTVNSETMNGLNGNDVMTALGGNDRMFAGNGDDWLFGNDGIDQLCGDRGNDQMNGGRGNDIYVGGLGNDVFEFGSHILNGNQVGSTYELANGVGDDLIADFKIGNDAIRLTGGVSISAVVQGQFGGPLDASGNLTTDGVLDTRLTLSREGTVVGTVTVLGISGASWDTVAEWNALLVA